MRVNLRFHLYYRLQLRGVCKQSSCSGPSIESRGKSGHKKQRCHGGRFSWSRNLHITTPSLLITSPAPAPAVDVAIWTTPHVGMYQLVSACCLKVDIKNQRKTNTYLGKKGEIGQPNIKSDASNGGSDDERWVDPTLYSLSRCHQHCHQLCCWTSAAPAFKSGIWYQTSVIFHFPVKLGIFVKSW